MRRACPAPSAANLYSKYSNSIWPFSVPFGDLLWIRRWYSCPFARSKRQPQGPTAVSEKVQAERDGNGSGALMDDPAQQAPATGALAPPAGPHLGGAVADPRFVLRLNNSIQFLTNGAWYVAIPFFPLYLVSQGASAGVVGAIVGLAGIVPLAVSIYAGALVDERGPVVVYGASTV